MATLTINIPDESLEELKRRAEIEGVTVEELILRGASRTTVDPRTIDFWNRLKNLPRIDIGMSGAEAVREAREQRDREIDEWRGRR